MNELSAIALTGGLIMFISGFVLLGKARELLDESKRIMGIEEGSE